MRNGFDRTTESFHCLADAMKEAAKEYKSLNLNTTMGNLLSCDGRRFRCKIDGTLATGIIRVVDGCVYLCQNEKNGSHSIDKKDINMHGVFTLEPKQILLIPVSGSPTSGLFL